MPDAAAPDNALANRPRALRARLTTIHLLQMLAVAALLLPLLLFCFASWVSYRSTHALADERIRRSLDVMQEQTLKVFQSMNLALDSIDGLVANRSAADIAAAEADLHERLRQIQAALPEVQSIWIFGPTGHPQVITREYPAPKADDFGDEDYFTVPRDGPPGIYIGGIHQSNTGGQPYFTFNRARHDAAGNFVGVIEMSLLPSDFDRFYSHLASGDGLEFALVRADGAMLARFPSKSAPIHLDARSGFHRMIATDPSGGFYTSTAENDHIERRSGARRIPGFPVYALVGIDTVQIRSEWMRGMALHLIFGIPATAFLFGAVLVVLQRTRRLYAEQDRREVAEATTRQVQRLDAVGRLTGGVAHDFNNLLTIIIGNLETAQRHLAAGATETKARIERALGNAMHGAVRAATLTQRLLAFSRLAPLDPRPLDLNRMLNDLSDFLSRSLGEAISLEVIGAAGLWMVEADQGQLEAALLNLAVNARDAMPDGGKLTLETSNTYIDDAYCRAYPDIKPGQYALVAVTDSGTGMSGEVRDNAFEPFFTTKPSGQGTGLGLSQVYGFVKQSGGHVKIYSEPGEGTTVKIYLPRVIGQTPVNAKVEDATPRGAEAGNGERILVVEDDADVRLYIVDVLRELNYDVAETPDAESALALAKDRKFDLLLTDVILPGKNGRQLAEALQAAQGATKVLFMTGYSRNAIVHQGRLDPGVQMLQKPVTSIELSRKVREVLGAAARRSAAE
jgi:two-component system, NtrC family, sensor kinase